MPSTSLKELHLAKSLKDLESRIDIALDFKKKSTNLLVSSAGKVYEAAEVSYLDKDEEKAYLHYMRFVELVLELKKRPDFKKDVSKHKKLLEYANTAISKAEMLKESLIKRYSVLQEAVCRENEINNIITVLNRNTPEIADDTDDDPPDKIKDEDKLSITSSELQSMLIANQSSIIIMDTRSQRDFSESHIKHSCCINVPQEILKPGLTSAKLESLLPKESLSLWYRRGEVDWIIFVDWDSKSETTENIHINTLKTAMSKWDQKCVLKKVPAVLKGGYKDWMLKYPMYTTKALIFELMNDVQTVPVLADLSAIEYPNLDENAIDGEHLNDNDSNDALFKKSSVLPFILNGTSSSPYSLSKKPYSVPAIDRRNKPNVILNSKPNSELKSNKNANGSAFSRKHDDSFPEKIIPPAVDRNLKNIILNAVTDENGAGKDVLDSFNKEQSLTKESLDIANQKLKSEEEFEKLCLRKELEAEESKRKEIQKQEEILIEKIKQLKLQSEVKDAELVKIQEENAKYKKLLEEESYKEYKREKKKEIAHALKEQINLRETVERLREERKKKEAESQKKKEVYNILPESNSMNSGLKKSNYPQDKAASSVTNASEYCVPLSRQSSSDSSSRGLVRSHSSPNIAQMVNEEENSRNKVPVIDRSLKPKVTANSQLSEINRARSRNLNPVYGNCPVRPATGLRNLGNTCFMNSVIQCLSNTIPLAEYIITGQYVEHVNRDNKQGTGGELIEEFAVVIKALWMGQYKSFSPRDFKNTVSRCLSVCIGNEQQDSHEFLVVLMEKMHADLSKRQVKVIPKLDPNCNETTFWQHHKSYNGSKISDIFEGLLKSTLTCLSCRKTSNSFEVSSCLSLPILNSKCSLKECFKHFLKPEKISGEAAWDCPRCKQKKEAEKRLSICRLPEVLVIQLKRFSYEGLWRRKLQTHVDFEFIFDVPFEENSYEFSRSYSLYGVVNHYGTLEGGHSAFMFMPPGKDISMRMKNEAIMEGMAKNSYLLKHIAYCKTNTGKWFKYDDHEVSEIGSSDIRTPAAYLLFYISSDFQSRL